MEDLRQPYSVEVEDISEAEEMEIEEDEDVPRIAYLGRLIKDKRQAVREWRILKEITQNKIMEIWTMLSDVQEIISTIRRNFVEGPGVTAGDLNRMNLMYTEKGLLEAEQNALKEPVICMSKWIRIDRREMEAAKRELRALMIRKYGTVPNCVEDLIDAEEDARDVDIIQS